MNSRLLLTGVVALLAGCSGMPLPPETTPDEPPPVARTAPRKGQSGGVFVPEAAWSLTADHRPFRPGDVLTIMLEETTQASKKADTKFGKASTVDVAPTVIGNNHFKTNVGVSAQRDFTGSSTSTQQNALQGAISVVVQDVLPNGLLQIKGDKSLTLNQGEEIIRLSGYVRASDVDTDNRLSSQRIANARITYAGKGSLADANTAGWLTRFFNSPWMPF
ncbi:MAG: flagellar basal body L-ring protein FlgH [Acidobacteriota bacterium]